MDVHDRKHPIQQCPCIDRIMNFAGRAFRNTKIQPTWWEEASDRSSLDTRGILGPPPLIARLAAPSPPVNYQPDRKTWRGQTSAARLHGKGQHQDHTRLGPPNRDLGPRPRSDRGDLGHHRAGGAPSPPYRRSGGGAQAPAKKSRAAPGPPPMPTSPREPRQRDSSPAHRHFGRVGAAITAGGGGNGG
jgi:hypothetical protein